MNSSFSMDELLRARSAVLKNAEGLLSDSLYLQVDGRYARSFAMAVLAAEELGKLAMLVRAFYATKASEPFDWDKLQRRIRSHEDKLQLFMLIKYINSSNAAAWKNPKEELIRHLSDPAERSKLDVAKQDGLYVRVERNAVRTPESEITQEMASTMWYSTQTHWTFFDEGERADPDKGSLAGISDLYGKIICLAEDLIDDPASIVLPR